MSEEQERRVEELIAHIDPDDLTSDDEIAEVLLTVYGENALDGGDEITTEGNNT